MTVTVLMVYTPKPCRQTASIAERSNRAIERSPAVRDRQAGI
jgi:hypothetical protein